MNLSDVRDRETISVETAGAILGLGRTAAYMSARRGEIPTLSIGRRLFVSTRALAAMLGATGFNIQSDPPANAQVEGGNDGSEAVRKHDSKHSSAEKPDRRGPRDYAGRPHSSP